MLLKKFLSIIITALIFFNSVCLSYADQMFLMPPSLSGIAESALFDAITSIPREQTHQLDEYNIEIEYVADDLWAKSNEEIFKSIVKELLKDTKYESSFQGIVFENNKITIKDKNDIQEALSGYLDNKLVMSVALTVIQNYTWQTSLQAPFMAPIFKKYKGKQLIIILYLLHNLYVIYPCEHTHGKQKDEEIKRLKNILGTLLLSDDDQFEFNTIHTALKDFMNIIDTFNERYMHLYDRFSIMRGILNSIKSCFEGKNRFIILHRMSSLIREIDPYGFIFLIKLTSIFEIGNRLGEEALQKKEAIILSRLAGWKKLYERMKECGVDFKEVFDKYWGMYDEFRIYRDEDVEKFEAVELIFNKSALPVIDFEEHVPGILKIFFRQRVLFSEDKKNIDILNNLKAWYERGYMQIPVELYYAYIQDRKKLEKIEQRFENNLLYIPSIKKITDKSHMQEREHWAEKENMELAIYISKYFKTLSGKPLPFKQFLKLSMQARNILLPLISEKEHTEDIKRQYDDIVDSMFRVIMYCVAAEKDDLDPDILLEHASIISQRMGMRSAKKLFNSIEHCIARKESMDSLLGLFDTFAYFAKDMEFTRGKGEIYQAIGQIEKEGIQKTYDACIQKKLAYERIKYPPVAPEKVVRNIKGITEEQRRVLLDELKKVNEYEDVIIQLPLHALQKKAEQIKENILKGEQQFNGIKCEYLAILREAAKRFFGIRAYNIQLASVLLYFTFPEVFAKGLVEEVKTGEGKSLIIALLAGMASLEGEPVDIFTVSTYLAKRDTIKFRKFYEFTGSSVDYIKDDESRSLWDANRKTFHSHIIYGTNLNFEFLYLFELTNQKPIRLLEENNVLVKRRFSYAIVDEVDSLFIDEAVDARIVSGDIGDTDSGWFFKHLYNFFQTLKENKDFIGNIFTPNGERKCRGFMVDFQWNEWEGTIEKELMIFHMKRYFRSFIKAMHEIKRDVHYILYKVPPAQGWEKKDKEQSESGTEDQYDIMLVDLGTGVKQPSSVWTYGLHQFVQIKEGIKPRRESTPQAVITHPFYFKKYKHVFTITGTVGSDTDEKELHDVYNLHTVRMPPHRTSLRIDYPDTLVDTEKQKWGTVVEEIESYHNKGRPVLVGVLSILESNIISGMLHNEGIEHTVLNGEQKKSQDVIIQEAGKKGMVTVATNLAGRGADILLGEGVEELGGLHVIGTFRFESKRIDNQLKGRAGRQGKPGSSHFIISKEDMLVRKYCSETEIETCTDAARLGDTAQKRAEIENFNERKRVSAIYAIQDNHMNRFFSMIEWFFNKKRMATIFPELLKQDEKLEDINSYESLLADTITKINLLGLWKKHLYKLDGLIGIFFEEHEYREFERWLRAYRNEAEIWFGRLVRNVKRLVFYYIRDNIRSEKTASQDYSHLNDTIKLKMSQFLLQEILLNPVDLPTARTPYSDRLRMTLGFTEEVLYSL